MSKNEHAALTLSGAYKSNSKGYLNVSLRTRSYSAANTMRYATRKPVPHLPPSRPARTDATKELKPSSLIYAAICACMLCKSVFFGSPNMEIVLGTMVVEVVYKYVSSTGSSIKARTGFISRASTRH